MKAGTITRIKKKHFDRDKTYYYDGRFFWRIDPANNKYVFVRAAYNS